jgi:hypothetical protein
MQAARKSLMIGFASVVASNGFRNHSTGADVAKLDNVMRS